MTRNNFLNKTEKKLQLGMDIRESQCGGEGSVPNEDRELWVRRKDKYTLEEASLYDVCEWWIKTYPDDIFIKEPKEVVQIRELMKEILKKRSR